MFRRSILGAALLAFAVAAPAVAQAQCDTSFALENRSNVQIHEAYFSPVTQDDWGEDRLGQNVLPPGRAMRFQPSPGGAYDFRIVFSNGQAIERRNVDLCVVGTVAVTPQGISVQ